jgi:hypothetical protein
MAHEQERRRVAYDEIGKWSTFFPAISTGIFNYKTTEQRCMTF